VRRLLFRRPKGLRRRGSNDVAADQLLRFAGVGVISTLGYLFLFVAWRPMLGALGANAVAMAIATLFNTAVHRELSHGSDALLRRGRMVLVVLSLYAISLALTTGALLVAGVVWSGALAPELVAITAANAVAAIFRFSVLRAWVFRPRALPNPAPSLEVSR
jgi:putative flippase GtrA